VKQACSADGKVSQELQNLKMVSRTARAVGWTTFKPTNERQGGGEDGDGVLVCFLDREVWFLRKDTPVDLIKEFCTATGARKHDREKELSPYGFPIN
jgi:hypothetical protein